MNHINIGDRIVISDSKYEYLVGKSGIIAQLYKDNTVAAVDFEENISPFGHDCCGEVPSCNGAFVKLGETTCEIIGSNTTIIPPKEDDSCDDSVKHYYNAMKSFLDGYGYEASPIGITRNITTWWCRKQRLIELLRKHPNWDEKAKAVVFDRDEFRDVNWIAFNDDLVALFNYIKTKLLSRCTPLNPDRITCAECSQRQGCCHYMIMRDIMLGYIHKNNTVTPELHDIIKARLGLDIPDGTKLSRAINKICSTYGFDKYTDVVKNADGDIVNKDALSYNKLFAKVADDLNPMSVKRHTVLSVNIMDFLTMSHGTGWKSCHNVVEPYSSGCYSGGTLSYALDDVSMIFYTVDAAYDPENSAAEYWQQSKITREIFCLNSEYTGLQSRLYPCTSNVAKMEEYRAVVQGVLATCIDIPNLWKYQTYDCTSRLANTVDGALHYPDYNYTSSGAGTYHSYLFRPLDFGVNTYTKIDIGSPAYDVRTGETNTNHSTLFNNTHCSTMATTHGTFSNLIVCPSCGEIVWESDIHPAADSKTGLKVCPSCGYKCDQCDTWFTEDYYNDHMAYVGDDLLCEDCIEEYTCTCYGCGERYYIGDMRYCDNIGDYVCEECYDEYGQYCAHCDKNLYDVDGEWYDDDSWVCCDCIEADFEHCTDCGGLIDKSEAYYVDGNPYCEHCYEDLATTCDECGDTIYPDDISYEIEGTIVCDSCIGQYIHDRIVNGTITPIHFDDISAMSAAFDGSAGCNVCMVGESNTVYLMNNGIQRYIGLIEEEETENEEEGDTV